MTAQLQTVPTTATLPAWRLPAPFYGKMLSYSGGISWGAALSRASAFGFWSFAFGEAGSLVVNEAGTIGFWSPRGVLLGFVRTSLRHPLGAGLHPADFLLPRSDFMTDILGGLADRSLVVL